MTMLIEHECKYMINQALLDNEIL